MLVGYERGIAEAVQAAATKDTIASLSGSWLTTSLLVTFCLGILLCQATRYFKSFPDDSPWLKRLVFMIVVLSITQTCIILAGAWIWFVTSAQDPTNLPHGAGWMASGPIIAQFIVFGAQSFFAYRCFILTRRNRAVLAFIVCCMIAGLALSVAIGVAVIENPYGVARAKLRSVPALCVNLWTDLVITGLTIRRLLASINDINTQTNTGLSKLIRVTWEAALPPAVAAIINLLVYLIMSSGNTYYAVFSMLIPCLYGFSLLFTLNSRPSIRGAFESEAPTDATMSLPLSQRPWSSTLKNKSDTATTSTSIVFAPMTSLGAQTALSTATLSTIEEEADDAHNNKASSTLTLPQTCNCR